MDIRCISSIYTSYRCRASPDTRANAPTHDAASARLSQPASRSNDGAHHASPAREYPSW